VFDVLFILLIVAGFGACIAYTFACGRL